MGLEDSNVNCGTMWMKHIEATRCKKMLASVVSTGFYKINKTKLVVITINKIMKSWIK
jgi:hypothetical protein